MQRPQPEPQRLPPRSPPPLAQRGFGGGAAELWIGAASSSQATAAAAVARARAMEQMAYEDAWKAINPDFRTPFASVEDAVSRLLPFHVFAEYEEDDIGDADARRTKSSSQRWNDEMEDVTLNLITEFEKQVLAFNVMARGRADGSSRAEEQLMLERALLQDERRLSEHVRALMVQQEQQRQDEAARTRLALAQAQAQAQAASSWQLAQQQAQAHAQAQARAEALAAAMARGEGFPGSAGQMAAPSVVMARGEGFPGLARQMAAPSVAMHPQHDPAAARAWQMMQRQHQQQHQQLLQLRMGVWPTFVAPHGEGSSSGHAGAPAVRQNQAVGQTTSAAAAAGTLQQWLRIAAQQREQ